MGLGKRFGISWLGEEVRLSDIWWEVEGVWLYGDVLYCRRRFMGIRSRRRRGGFVKYV